MELNDKEKFCDSIEFQNGLSESVLKAIAAGKGKNTLGLSKGAVCGQEYYVTDIEFRTSLPKPKGWVKVDENGHDVPWNALSEEEKKEAGSRLIEWYTLVTDKGDISFTQFFGSSEYDTEEFWKNADFKANDFDVKNRLHPVSKSPLNWIKHDCKVIRPDGNQVSIKGQWIHCTASADDESGEFTTKARLIAFGRLPKDNKVTNLAEIRAKEAEEKAKQNAENPDDAQ